jgi:broad specificity phosphatase PhoE
MREASDIKQPCPCLVHSIAAEPPEAREARIASWERKHGAESGRELRERVAAFLTERART